MFENFNEKSEGDYQVLEDKAMGSFIKLFFLGFSLVVLGIIFLAISTMLSNSSNDIAVVVFIGPIPLVFGAGPHALIFVAFSIFIAAVMFLLLFLYLRKA